MDNGNNNNTVHVGSNGRPKRFVPTCPICGNQHWPRDPSCLGKKGAKAKAKAKGSAKAKARAERLGPAENNTYHQPDVQVQVQAQVQPTTPASSTVFPAVPASSGFSVQPAMPGRPNVPVQPAQPVSSPVFPPRENNVTQPVQQQQQYGGEQPVNIQAKSYKEITSFEDELARVKRQADEVILRASEDAAHRVNSERTARINAEEKLKEAMGKVEQLRKQIQAKVKTPPVENVQQKPASEPLPVAQPDLQNKQQRGSTSSLRVAPSYTNSNVGTLLAIRARDIMDSNVVWVKPDDTISSVLDSMLARDSYYAIIIANGSVEGIVSRDELSGPICENLKPFVGKWQRPGTDATFNVAIKWIMSKQVNVVEADTNCTGIMKKMRSLNMCPLPVVDEGKVIGLVTPFDVFKIRALLKLESDVTASSNKQIIQELPARINSYMSEIARAKVWQSETVK